MHGDDPERCYGEGGRRGDHVWERMYTRGGFMSMYGKTNTVLQSKIKFKKKTNINSLVLSLLYSPTLTSIRLTVIYLFALFFFLFYFTILYWFCHTLT